MGRITRAEPHLLAEEVKERMRNDPNPLYRERWSIIYTAQVHPREAKEIAKDLGKMSFLILPYTNTEMMNIFLKQVSEDFSSYFIVMQVDQAGWHGAADLVIPKNIRLLPQPAYSPELNPVEHLWDELREKYFANGYSDSLDEIIQILCDGLMQLESDPKYLRSMTYFPHLRIFG